MLSRSRTLMRGASRIRHQNNQQVLCHLPFASKVSEDGRFVTGERTERKLDHFPEPQWRAPQIALRANIVITRRAMLHDDSTFGKLTRDFDSKAAAATGGARRPGGVAGGGRCSGIARPKAALRTGWAEASRRLAAAGDDVLVLPEFANESDAELTW